MTNYPVGFHFGPGGTSDGINEYLSTLEAAGLGGFIKSVDHYGICYLAAQRNRSGATHNIVYRMKALGTRIGVDLDVPHYDSEPEAAAKRHWDVTMSLLPSEFDRQHVWLEIVNEVDKNRAEWLAEFAIASYALAKQARIKLAMFGWSTGEPEPEHWTGPSMQRFLELCASDREGLAIALHEYSLDDNLFNQSPWLVGRYKFLHSACDEMGIGYPTILITEFGWHATTVPPVGVAKPQLASAASMYAADGVVGAGIWYFGAGWNGIHASAAPLIPAVTENSKSFDPPDPPDPPTEEPPMVNYVVKVHLLPQDASAAEAQTVLVGTAYPSKESVVFSADDAARLVAPGLPGSTVFVWWPERWGGKDAISSWMKAHGVQNVVFKPDGVLSGLKLGQLFNSEYVLTEGFNAPRDYANGLHEGADYDVTEFAANSAAMVLAMASGKLVYAGWDNTGYGNLVIVESEHAGIMYRLWYAHLDSIAVSAPGFIDVGAAVGEVGNTGNSRGEHIHITLQVPGHGLDGYSVSDVVDPAPYIPKYQGGVTPPPLPATKALLGLHASADPSLAQGEVGMFVQARAEAVKVMSHHNPDQLRQLKQALPNALYVVRVYLSHGNRVVTPGEFVSWTISDLQRTLGIVGRDALIEVHNEPNLKDEGMWHSWQNGREFGAFYLDVANRYRQALGAYAKFVFPGLSPGGDEPGVRYDSNRFAREARDAIWASDYLGVHVYWAKNWPVSRALDDLRGWASAFPNKKIVVTEASNNKPGTSAADKGREYIKFVSDAAQVAPVVAVTYFVASASNPGWGWGAGSCETWLGTEIPVVVGGR